MTAGGVVVGLLAAIGLGQFITDQLYGVTLTDAPTFIAVTLLVITVLHASLLAPG